MIRTSGKLIEHAWTRTSSSPAPAPGSAISRSTRVSGPPGASLSSARIELVLVARRGLLAHFLASHAGRELDEPERTHVIASLEDREIGDDHVDHILAGQRKRAFGDELGIAVFGRVLHHDDDL